MLTICFFLCTAVIFIATGYNQNNQKKKKKIKFVFEKSIQKAITMV